MVSIVPEAKIGIRCEHYRRGSIDIRGHRAVGAIKSSLKSPDQRGSDALAMDGVLGQRTLQVLHESDRGAPLGRKEHLEVEAPRGRERRAIGEKRGPDPDARLEAKRDRV